MFNTYFLRKKDSNVCVYACRDYGNVLDFAVRFGYSPNEYYISYCSCRKNV